MSFLNGLLDEPDTVIQSGDPPLRSGALPENAGVVTLWTDAFELYLTSSIIDRLAETDDFGEDLAHLVGAMVSVSGGSLAPVASHVLGHLVSEWAAILRQCNDNGVRLVGTLESRPWIVLMPG